jgi:hypothetical protein
VRRKPLGIAAYHAEVARLIAAHQWLNIEFVQRDGTYTFLQLNGVRYA